MKTKIFLIASLISFGLISMAFKTTNDLSPHNAGETPDASLNFADEAIASFAYDFEDETKIYMTNYPDPFVGDTKIVFWLSEATHLELWIHDMQTGKAVMILEGFKEKGEHVIKYSAKDVKPGLLVAEIIAEKGRAKEIMENMDSYVRDSRLR